MGDAADVGEGAEEVVAPVDGAADGVEDGVADGTGDGVAVFVAAGFGAPGPAV